MNGCVPGTYLLESVIRGGTYIISWFVEKMGDICLSSLGVSPEEVLEVAASKIPPGSQGLIAIPHWSGSMTPYWDPLSKGITLGWSAIHGKAHFYRSILEGIAFEQKLINQGIEKALGSKIEEILLLGGGARSQLWCQMVSDILNVPMGVAREIEATSLGAGMLAAYGAGLYPTVREASLAMSAISRRYLADPKRAEIYQKIFQEVYTPLFPAVQPLVDRLTKLVLEIESEI
jgi:xylulokinase